MAGLVWVCCLSEKMKYNQGSPVLQNGAFQDLSDAKTVCNTQKHYFIISVSILSFVMMGAYKK